MQKKKTLRSEYYLLDQKINKWNCGVTYPSPSLDILLDGRLSPSLRKFKTRAKSENRRNSAPRCILGAMHKEERFAEINVHARGDVIPRFRGAHPGVVVPSMLTRWVPNNVAMMLWCT